MTEPKYKVGEKFQTPASVREILAVSVTIDGCVRYWVDDDGDRDPGTVTESRMDSWRKIEPFFEIGKTYRFPAGSYRYKVTDIRVINGEKFAWAETVTLDGPAMATLDKDDFEGMTEV